MPIKKRKPAIEGMDLPALRVEEDRLMTIVREACKELDSVRGEIRIRMRQNYNAKKEATK